VNCIEQHIHGTATDRLQYTGHYRDGDTPVQVIIHRDPYAFQCYGFVSRWTTDTGYRPVVSADPDAIYGRRRLPEADLFKFARELLDTYKAMTGGAS
jgi:hypothetical protein